MLQMILKNVLWQFKELLPAAVCSALLWEFLVSISEPAKAIYTHTKATSDHKWRCSLDS